VPLKAVSATITIDSLSGMTGTVTAAHVHGPAFNGVNAPPIVTLCGPPSSNSCSSGSPPFVFPNVNVPLELLGQGSLYLNLHTLANPGGEIRGQLAVTVPISPLQATDGLVQQAPDFQSANAILFPNATMQTSFSVPLSVGQEFLLSQNTTLSYVASPMQEASNNIVAAGCPSVSTLSPSARFSIVINPAGQSANTIIFSTITVTGLSSNMQFAHIHGPCTIPRCNTGVVYTICGSNKPCPLGTDVNIDTFMVQSADFSTSSLLSGDAFFYVNIHTINNPLGELRADLNVPRGTATVFYTPASTPSFAQIGANPRISVVPASVSITLTGLTSNVQAIHLHGPAAFGVNAGVLVPFCGGGGSTGVACSAVTDTSFTQTFSNINWPINVAASGTTYFNVHTLSNQAGEVRGQVVRQIQAPNPTANVGNGNGGVLTLAHYSDSLCSNMPADPSAFPIIGQSSIPGLNLPIWGFPNPFVANLTCNPAGSRVGPNGQNVTVYWSSTQCSSQGSGAIIQVFYDRLCTIPFTPAELIPANQLGRCVQVVPPTPDVAPSGLYSKKTCGADSVSFTVPLSAYPENAVRNFSFTGSAQLQIPIPSQACAVASFNVVFDPTSSTKITFSAITISGKLTGPLAAVHIHGPCPTNTPCNAGVVYWICGTTGAPAGVASCPPDLSPTIPSFSVDFSQNANNDNSLLLALMSGILSGNNLYYVNFHTAK
jgi:hypothetical protein